MLHSFQHVTPCGLDYRFIVSLQPNLTKSGLLVLVQLKPDYRPSLLVASFRFSIDDTLGASLKLESLHDQIERKVASDPEIGHKLFQVLRHQNRIRL